MKHFVVLAALIGLCLGEDIPMVPGDNTRYVEGKSRYIWMPDGDTTPQLVDLHDLVDEELLLSRIGANNAYFIFTRRNPHHAHRIILGDDNTVWSSYYVPGHPLVVIVHGWNSDGSSAVNTLIRDAFLDVVDANVIVVDWSALANANYVTAASGVSSVGQAIGQFLVWLFNTAGGHWNNVHLVGFGLGAHIVGNTGRSVHGWPIRITGLDPAGPLWGKNNNSINGNDGKYVECIHTDGGILGVYKPVCNTDFYPNGGKHPQPGCWTSTCSHGRAYELFAATVHYNHLHGRQCDNLSQTSNGQCAGTILPMGNYILDKQGNGIFSVSASNIWPY